MRTASGRRSTALAIVASLAVTVALGTMPASADTPIASASTTTATSQTGTDGTQSAMDTAKATGQPVEITSATTENTQLFANPDGTLSLKVTPQPARVRQGGT